MARHSFCIAVALACLETHVSALAYASNSSFVSSAVLTLPSSYPAASTSSPPASITASASIPGTNGTCSKYCGFNRLFFSSVYWSQWITPVTVGTVYVVVDDTTNKTSTTTRYNSVTEVIVGSSTLPLEDLISNGIYTPASTTMTGTVEGFDSKTTTLTYPTPWYTVYPSITWGGTIPWEEDGTTTCSTWGSITTGSSEYFPWAIEPSPLPSHPPWSTSTPAPDSDDPLGNWYTVQDDYGKESLDATDVATLWPSDPFLLEIYGCVASTAPAAATAVQTVAALLATSTQHVTSAPKPTKEPAEPVKPGAKPTGGKETGADPIGTPTSPTKEPQAPETQGPNPSPPVNEANPPPNDEENPPSNNGGNPSGEMTTACTGVGCFVATGIGANPGPSTKTEQAPGPGPVTTRAGNTNPTFVVGGQTLAPDSTLTVSGTTYSLPETPTAIYVNGESQTLPANPTAPVTVNGVAITPVSGSTPSSITEFLIGSQTLLPGSTVVVSGTTYSLPASGTGIYIDGRFTAVPTSGGEGEAFSIGDVAVTPTEVAVEPSASWSVVPADPNGADARYRSSWALGAGGVVLAMVVMFA